MMRWKMGLRMYVEIESNETPDVKECESGGVGVYDHNGFQPYFFYLFIFFFFVLGKHLRVTIAGRVATGGMKEQLAGAHM